MRRRAGWIAVSLAVAAGVAVLGVYFSNTGQTIPSTFGAGPPQIVPAAPKQDAFTAEERKEVTAVAARFVRSAVFRQNVADSWALTTSRLRQGLTRSAWASIPIVPYPAASVLQVRWRVNYSYTRSIGLKVAFFPKPKSGVARQTFDIELEDHGTPGHHRWLVSFWAPSGIPQDVIGGASAPTDPTPLKGQVRAIWLLVPVGAIIGTLLALLGFLALRGWVRHSRANRAYSKL
jgi:hypothetical protein